MKKEYYIKDDETKTLVKKDEDSYLVAITYYWDKKLPPDLAFSFCGFLGTYTELPVEQHVPLEINKKRIDDYMILEEKGPSSVNKINKIFLTFNNGIVAYEDFEGNRWERKW
ncbi:hypothetical protein D3C72_1402160 [compost metagenome]